MAMMSNHLQQLDGTAGAAIGDMSIAKEAVCFMEIPDHVVQLAIDTHHLEHGTDFTDVQQLYLAAADLCHYPNKQADLTKKLQLANEAIRKQQTVIAEEDKENAKQQRDSRRGSHPKKRRSTECPDGIKVKSASSALRSDRAMARQPYLVNRVKRLAKENHRLKQRKMCRACRKVALSCDGVTFLSCGHFITCEECSEMFDDCPACGKTIMATVRTYLS